MKIKEKVLILAVFVIVCGSFMLPKYIIISQEKSMINQVEYIDNNYFSSSQNQIYSLPVISELEELCHLFVYGEKLKAETIPTNEKSPLVLIELVQAEIVQLQESNILPAGNFMITDTSSPFLYTLDSDKTIVWEFSLIDESDNRLEITYHSGVGKIIELDYYSLNFSVEDAKLDHFNNLEKYFVASTNDANIISLVPSKDPYISYICSDVNLLCQYSDTGFSVGLIKTNYLIGNLD